MRKALPITFIFFLLTFSIAPFAMAQKQNIITNETTETLYVVYSTKFGAQGAIPDGYRTSGWKTIAAGQQRTFWAYDPHKVYFQIFKGSQPIKPERSTETFAFWINRNANFDIVTRQEINASITRDQLLYSSHGTNPLTHRDGFMQYDNGSRITVTDTWVAVVESTPNPIVNIPDTALRRAIEQKLELRANTPITQADMETLTNLFSVNSPDPDHVSTGTVSDLTGLEFATNLTSLVLYGNGISDISPLAKLVNLTSLDLDGNRISDISPLAKLVNLTSLSLAGNDISDISPLANLVKLETLYLGDGVYGLFGGNDISDISPLAELINLKILSLSLNDISDISPLKDLVNLTDLDLYDNDISDVSPLKDLVNLTDLDLRDNSISDFSPIDKMIPNLEEYWNTGQKVTGPTTPPNPPDDTSDADDFDPLFPDAEPPSPAVDDGSSDLPVNIPDPVTSDATVGSVDPAQIEARSVGEQLMVNINITGGADVARYQVTVNFDPTALEYASSAHGDYLPAGAIVLPAQVPDSGDSVILSAIGGTAIGGTADGDGTLATITFNVVAAKASIITLTDVSITASVMSTLY